MSNNQMIPQTSTIDKLANYHGKHGSDLIAALICDNRLRPTVIDGIAYLSMVNLMEVFGDWNSDPRIAWRDQKRRLKKQAPQLWEKFSQLKLTAPDGKERLTDVADADTAFRSIAYLNTPTANTLKEELLSVLGQYANRQAEWNYRIINIANGKERGAEGIRELLAGDEFVPETKGEKWRVALGNME